MDYKKATERQAVRHYLNYYNLPHEDVDLVNQEEKDSIDVSVPKHKLNFQVTTVEGGPIRLLREKKYKSETIVDQAIQKFIIKPIEKKIKKYGGKSVENVILLIQTNIFPPTHWLRPNTEEKKKLEAIFLKSGFISVSIVADVSGEVMELFRKKFK